MADQTEWLTYEAAAAALDISAEAVRARARRQAWPRMRGDDGRALVRLPAEDPAQATRENAPPAPRPDGPALDKRLLAAFEVLAQTFRDQLAMVRADLQAVRAELAEERRNAREAALVYRQIAQELAAMRKARSAAPNLAEAWRELREARAAEEAALNSTPPAPRPSFNQAEYVDRLAEIRRQIEETLQTRH